jgi:hypothetical protein
MHIRFMKKMKILIFSEARGKGNDPIGLSTLYLVGYLENLISDPKLIEHCSIRFDVLFFIDYDMGD